VATSDGITTLIQSTPTMYDPQEGVSFLFPAFSGKSRLLLGVDQSEMTIEYLSSNYGNLGNAFDAVYSSDVLEHVTNTQWFVDNIHRHLRAGAKDIVNFPNESNHGSNHFNEVEDVRALFGALSSVRVFIVDIQLPVDKLWRLTKALYESLFSRSTREARNRLYSEREEQGIDCFEESACYSFINNSGKVRNWMASILAETFVLMKPTIDSPSGDRQHIE
jgi:hypothetical protein